MTFSAEDDLERNRRVLDALQIGAWVALGAADSDLDPAAVLLLTHTRPSERGGIVCWESAPDLDPVIRRDAGWLIAGVIGGAATADGFDPRYEPRRRCGNKQCHRPDHLDFIGAGEAFVRPLAGVAIVGAPMPATATQLFCAPCAATLAFNFVPIAGVREKLDALERETGSPRAGGDWLVERYRAWFALADEAAKKVPERYGRDQ